MRAETCILPEKEELVGGQDNAVVTIGTRATREKTLWKAQCVCLEITLRKDLCWAVSFCVAKKAL